MRMPPGAVPTSAEWSAIIGRSVFHCLGPAAVLPPFTAGSAGVIVLPRASEPDQARREVARLCYIGAARAHFFSALIVLAALVVLGVAQTYGPLPFLPAPIPTVPAVLAVAGLVLLAVLARIAVDVAAEPLIETLARTSAEAPEAGALRDPAEFFPALSPPDATMPQYVASPATEALLERLSAIVERGQRDLLDAAERLSGTTTGLAETTRSSLEALEATFRAAESRAHAPAPTDMAATAALSELRDAVATLTALLQRAREAAPAAEGEPPTLAAPAAAGREREPDLALELRKLLQEIEATS